MIVPAAERSNWMPDAALADINTLVLRARDLTLDYTTHAGATRAVEHIEFEVRQGERLVFLGPSGCGKSSILKAVCGFIPAASGEILVRGRKVASPGPDRAMVFQEFDQLLPWKTVEENVAFPLRHALRLGQKAAREQARAALGSVGLSHVLTCL
ncbi:MAG: ATP-binding cassette domain-containing protein [Hyphomicrobium sp.]|jgi:NitT/TauT family transport system ATP-binding protein